jgi:TRAP-type C4-dicarboxylate transport system permease small subunit
MTTLKVFRKLNQALANVLRAGLVVVFAILVVDVLWGVASRYLLGSQASWSEELARLLLVWLALLGAALACREDRHLGLDVIVRLWPEAIQRLGRLFVCFVIICFACGIMACGGWQLVSQRFASGQTLPALGVAKAWFYLALPVSGVLITLFMAESFWATLVDRESDSDSGGESQR